MEAIVLAGGFGTRLRHVVSDVPKPMAPVAGRPFLRYVLNELTERGVDRIVLAVGYMREAIMEGFGDAYRGAKLIYSPEDTPLFTGGAVKKALELCLDDEVFVVNGDTLFEVDLAEMADFYREKNADFVMAVRPMHDFDRYGTVVMDQNGRIERFLEKRHMKEGLINGGIYLMKKEFLRNVPEEAFSLEKDVLERYVHKKRFYAFVSDGYFIDIGVPDDYKKAQYDFKNRHIVRKAAFFDRDGTINKDIGYLYRIEDLNFINGMPEFISCWKRWGYKIIVVTNQSGIARGMYTEDDMRKLHRYMNKKLKPYGAHIDAFYYCPHHPDFTGPCHCRKPEPGMLKHAIADFELDPRQCIMFGDQPWDIEAAKRCGITGIFTDFEAGGSR